MGIILGFLARAYPSSSKGLNLWASATFAVLFATVTQVWLRNITSDEVAIGAQNVFLIMTAGLFLAGSAEFFERPLPRGFLTALFCVAVISMALFASYSGSATYRRLFARALLIGLYGFHTWIIYKQPKTAARYLTFGTLSSVTALIVFRTITGYWAPAEDGVDSEALIQMLYAVGYSSTDVLIPICAILMTSEKIRFTFEQLAMQDSLTGALTRRAMMELGESELAGCQRRGQPMTLLMLDLDQFKAINDLHGHHVGDLVLQDFAERVSAILRRLALFARYGGDEFIAILPRTSESEAALVAERIRSSSTLRAELPRCGVSIGLVCAEPNQRISLGNLIDLADQSLYQAKALHSAVATPTPRPPPSPMGVAASAT
jgi:diguanylate cyclase (GGDEF)-like protein